MVWCDEVGLVRWGGGGDSGSARPDREVRGQIGAPRADRGRCAIESGEDGDVTVKARHGADEKTETTRSTTLPLSRNPLSDTAERRGWTPLQPRQAAPPGRECGLGVLSARGSGCRW
jgi:hypothetical protein